jgi:hypothetical protein
MLTISAPPQTAWTGTPFAIPGKIEAEYVDNGGEGVAYHDTTPTTNEGDAPLRTAIQPSDGVDVYSLANGGYALGSVYPSEWVEYTTTVATTTKYDVDVRYSRASGGTSDLAISSNGVAGVTASLPSTSNLSTYHVFTVPALSLTAGTNVLQLLSSSGSTQNPQYNIDWFRVRQAQPAMTQKLRDDFEGVTQGQALSTHLVPGTSIYWNSLNATLDAGTFDATGANVSGYSIGTVPYVPTAGKQSVVEAQLNPNGATWLALGFTQTATQGWPGSGQIWAYVTSGRRFAVYANGQAVTVAPDQDIPATAEFRATEYNQVRLIYDQVNKTAALWINGIQVLAPTVIPGGFVPAIQYAGWSGLAVQTAKVDAFVLGER